MNAMFDVGPHFLLRRLRAAARSGAERPFRLAALLGALGTLGCATSDPRFFRIDPLRPVPELRAEALRAAPPEEVGEFLPSDLVELTALDPTIRLDIRYATERNFLGEAVYEEARAFLQRPAAEALVRAHRRLRESGYGLLVHDGYRPWFVTRIFWDATPAAQHAFVADPTKGSRHNRGCAVDLTLFELATGRAVEMPSLYDEMTERSYADYPGGSAEARGLRSTLRAALEAEGFTVLPEEWWHFDFRDWRSYRIENVPFQRIDPGRGVP
jgi:D-alanyl-D-alanine dipeptidase